MLSPTEGLHAYVNGSDPRRVELEFGNLAALPIEVLRARSGSVLLEPASTTVVPASPPSQGVAWPLVPFEVKGETAWSDPLAETLEVEYRMVGSSQLRQAKVVARPRMRHVARETRHAPPADVGDFAFLKVDEEEGVIGVLPGTWTVDRDLVVPAGYRSPRRRRYASRSRRILPDPEPLAARAPRAVR